MVAAITVNDSFHYSQWFKMEFKWKGEKIHNYITHTHTTVKSLSAHLYKGRTEDQFRQIASQVAVTFIHAMLSSLSVVLL